MPLLLLLVACGGGSAEWEKTTVPFDPACGDCTPLEVSGLDHVGDVEIYSTEADDPLAQWAGCVASILDCADQASDPGGALAGCVEQSTCPTGCQKAFQRDGADIDAFESVFLAAGGRCSTPSTEVAP